METIDWQGMNVDSYPLIEPSMYLVKILDWKSKEAQTGTPQIEWKGVTVDDVGGVPAGTPVHDFTALSSAALWRLGSLVQACGFDLKTLPKMIIGSEEFNRVCNALKGRKVYWDITQDTYQGKTRNKVASYMPYEDQGPLNYDPENVPSFIKNKTNVVDPELQRKAKKAGLI